MLLRRSQYTNWLINFRKQNQLMMLEDEADQHLTAPDFFLWGYVKETIYINKRWTRSAQEKYSRRNRGISAVRLSKVLDDVARWIAICEHQSPVKYIKNLNKYKYKFKSSYSDKYKYKYIYTYGLHK